MPRDDDMVGGKRAERVRRYVGVAERGDQNRVVAEVPGAARDQLRYRGGGVRKALRPALEAGGELERVVFSARLSERRLPALVKDFDTVSRGRKESPARP